MKTIKCIKLVGVFCLLLFAKISIAQVCAVSFTATPGISGSYNFITSVSGNTMAAGGYFWTFGNGSTATYSFNSTAATTYTANGIYTVTLVFMNSAVNCTTTATQTISVNNAGTCSLNAGLTWSQGPIGYIVLNAGASGGVVPGASYTWIYGDGSPNGSGSNNTIAHTYTALGSYNAKVIINNNLLPACIDSATAVITTTSVPCNANSNFTVVPTATAQVWNVIPASPSNIINAYWSWGDNTTSNTLYTSHNYAAAGNYSICLSVTVSCGNQVGTSTSCSLYNIFRSNRDMSMIQVNVVNPATGLLNSSIEQPVYIISPNPSNGSFKIQASGLGTKNVKIVMYDLVGKVIYEAPGETTDGVLVKEMQLHGVANGVYFIEIGSGEKTFTQKMILKD
ncbi:MAG: PKD domain-containing protein [Bacteroidota bacterium]